MSRLYEMYVTIKNLPRNNKNLINRVTKVAKEEWDFDDWGKTYESETVTLDASGRGWLAGGEREEDFCLRLVTAIWKEAKSFLEIEITSTCLEDLPHEWYIFDQDDYDEWEEGGRSFEDGY